MTRMWPKKRIVRYKRVRQPRQLIKHATCAANQSSYLAITVANIKTSTTHRRVKLNLDAVPICGTCKMSRQSLMIFALQQYVSNITPKATLV